MNDLERRTEHAREGKVYVDTPNISIQFCSGIWIVWIIILTVSILFIATYAMINEAGKSPSSISTSIHSSYASNLITLEDFQTGFYNEERPMILMKWRNTSEKYYRQSTDTDCFLLWG